MRSAYTYQLKHYLPLIPTNCRPIISHASAVSANHRGDNYGTLQAR